MSSWVFGITWVSLIVLSVFALVRAPHGWWDPLLIVAFFAATFGPILWGIAAEHFSLAPRHRN